MARKKVKRVKKSKSNRVKLPVTRKIHLVSKNLIIFGILAIISLIIFVYSTEPIYENFFLLLTFLFGVLVLAFLIALFVLLILKAARKRN